MDEFSAYYNEDALVHRQEPGRVKRFFFACAGAYVKILETCPSEHTKYVGIGATIFLTACLAVLSGSFAIYTLVENAFVSFLFGLLWGALIFNLDRYIVSSIRKEGRLWHELGLAFPRLVLAVLISIVITKPIEVELFHNQINSELFTYTSELEKQAEETLDQKLGLDSLRAELHKIDNVRQEYKKLKDAKPTSFDFGEVTEEYQVAKNYYDSLNRLYTPRIEANEARRSYLWEKYASKVYDTDKDGNNVFVRWDFPKKWQDKNNQLYNINKGLKSELADALNQVKLLERKRKGAREAYAQSLNEEINLLQNRRNELSSMIASKDNIRDSELPSALEKAKKYGKGFPAKIQVLEKMKDEDSSIYWMSTLIVLLFILIETSPVFVKLITKRGPYDYLLSRIEHHKKVEALRYISDMNYDLNATMQLQARKSSQKVNGVHQGEEVFSEN